MAADGATERDGGAAVDAAAALAAFAVEASPGGAAAAMMRLSLMDWAACAIAGAAEPVSRIVRGLELAAGGAAEATVVGSGTRLPARAAALVNGTVSHALDYDDTHFAHIGHPSVAVVPAALAVAEATGARGTALLTAATVGAEASIRVGVWLGRTHYQTGFHQTATAGAFGATVAAGRLMGLDAGAMGHALGIAATRAAGLKSQFGTMGKPYNAGIAAETGVQAARMAAAGFHSNPGALVGPQGFGPTHAGEADMAGFAGLGQVWLLTAISHKFHACCHGLHAMLEALRGVRLAPEAVDRVTVRTHPRWLTVCNQPSPTTGLGAKFSFRLTAAMALAGWDTGALGSYSAAACRDPVLVRLRDRVSVLADPDLAETASAVHVDAAGRSHVVRHDLTEPLSMEVRAAKLRAKARALLGADGAAALDAAATAPEGPDLAALTALLAAARP